MTDTSPKLILGSGSPRRLELLAQLGLIPSDVRAPDINEDPRPGEKPRDYVRRMAREKAEASVCGKDEVVKEEPVRALRAMKGSALS